MGSSGSKPIFIPGEKPPARRDEEEYPVVDPTGIGKGMAQGCQWDGSPCQLVVPQGVSASAAKLYRDQGSIRRDLCKRYAKDLEAVTNSQKSFEEVKKDLVAGAYYEELPRGDNAQGYCRQIMYDAVDLKGITSPDKLPLDKVRYPVIRMMSDSGSYSSVTKLFIKPTIPFEVEFNGKKHRITILTLMHPSPIRVENIQHDAMMTLGDPGDGNNDGLVVLVPLVGSITAGPSGDFVNKVVRYMTGVLQPDPVTGQYESIDIPTGNDWDVSKLFPGTPGEGGKTYVTKTGYYVWSGSPPLVLQPTGDEIVTWAKPWVPGAIYLNQPNIQKYSWQPNPNAAPIRYVMLSRPATVSSLDLQTIRMLPMTPPTEALAPIVKDTLSYRTADSCPASPPAAADLTKLFSREGYENPLSSINLPKSLKAPTIDKCDPLAGFSKEPPGKDALIQALIWTLTTFGVLLAIYFAVVIWTKYKPGQWLADKGMALGNRVAQIFITDERKLIPKDPLFEVTAAEEEEERRKSEERTKKEDAAASSGAEARLAASLSAENPLAAPKRHRAKLEQVAKETEAELKAKEDAEIEAAGVEAEAEAEKKKKAEEEYRARFTEGERPRRDVYRQRAKDAEAEAKRMAEEAKAEEAKKKAEEEAEAEAKKKADEEAEAKKKAEEEAKAEEAKKKADEEAEAKKKAEEEEEAKKKAEEEEEAKKKAEEEDRIKAASEAAAASASKAAERQTKGLKKRKVESSDRDLLASEKKAAESAAAPAARSAPPPGHPPPTDAEVSSALGTAKDLAKDTKAAATLSTKRPPAAKLSEGDAKAKRMELDALQTKVFGIAILKRISGLHTAQWKTKTAWVRYEDERKFQTQLKQYIGTFLKFKTAVETSGLDSLARTGYETTLKESGKTLEDLLQESKGRIEHITQDAPPARIVKGGRRKMKRKSTRRYVA